MTRDDVTRDDETRDDVTRGDEARGDEARGDKLRDDSFSGDPSGRESVLESNVARLFAASWVPVEPDVAFANDLRARLERELEQRTAVGARSDPRDDASTFRPTPLHAPLHTAPTRLALRLRLAATFLALLGAIAAAWFLARDPRSSNDARDLVAKGCVAVRAAAGDWRSATDAELAQGIDVIPAGARISTPTERAITARLGHTATIEIAADTDVAIAAKSPNGARDITVAGSSVRARRDADASSWRLVTPDGVVAFAHGDLTWSSAAADEVRPDDAASWVLLARGEARLEGPESVQLAVGQRVWLARGAVLVALAIDAPRTGDARTPAETLESAPTLPNDDSTRGEPAAPKPANSQRAALEGVLALPADAAANTHAPTSFRVTLLRRVRLPEVTEPESTSFQGATTFAIDDLRPGQYDVFVEASGFAVARRLGLELAAGGTERISVELAPDRFVRGVVRDAATRAPIAGAVVLAELLVPAQVVPFHPDVEEAGWRASTRTRADGSFTLTGLDAPTVDLRVSARGRAARWLAAVPTYADGAANAGSELDPVDLAPGGAVEGRVARPDGTPWASARVIASRMGTGSFGERMSFGMTQPAADGAYRVDDLPPGDYVVLAFDPTAFGMPATRNFRIERDEVVHIDVGPTDRRTRVVGTIRDAQGAGWADLDVMIGHDEPGGGAWIAERTDAEGSFSFEGVDPGHYTIFVGRGLGASFAIVDEFDVPLAPHIRHDIVLPGGSIRGRVLAVDGGPAAEVSLIVTGAEREGARFVGRVQTNGAGEFELIGIAAGDYAVVAHDSHAGVAAVRLAPVVVGSEPRSIELRLVPGVELHVNVVDAHAAPLAGRVVHFTDESGTAWRFSADGRTDAQGMHVVPGLAPGRWRVRVDGAPEQVLDLELGAGRAITFRIDTDTDAVSSEKPEDRER